MALIGREAACQLSWHAEFRLPQVLYSCPALTFQKNSLRTKNRDTMLLNTVYSCQGSGSHIKNRLKELKWVKSCLKMLSKFSSIKKNSLENFQMWKNKHQRTNEFLFLDTFLDFCVLCRNTEYLQVYLKTITVFVQFNELNLIEKKSSCARTVYTV